MTAATRRSAAPLYVKIRQSLQIGTGKKMPVNHAIIGKNHIVPRRSFFGKTQLPDDRDARFITIGHINSNRAGIEGAKSIAR